MDAAAPLPDRDAPTSSASRPVILVVDDEPMCVSTLALIMRMQGYDVLSAPDGKAGLALSRTYQGRIDLVISDEEMPGLNGSALCQRLLNERPGIKALIVTGADPATIRFGNVPVLPKPCDSRKLCEAVGALLAASRLAPL